jgi:DNA-binding transcriptional MerR regulator
LLLKGIRHLLYDQGFTIKGVQRILKDEGPRHVISIGEAGGLEGIGATADGGGVQTSDAGHTKLLSRGDKASGGAKISAKGRDRLAKVMRELLECKRLLDNAREG